MIWSASAPSNIALIKYMGKLDHHHNQATNRSLSYTLSALTTEVTLSCIRAPVDKWQPYSSSPLTLSASAVKRFLKHLQFIKEKLNYQGSFLVQSKNNFPNDCGLASSASSFAALTRCAITAICELTEQVLPSTEQQALLSKKGSGSSCRSFYSPWACWQEETVTSPNLPYNDLIHSVLILDDGPKQVSSSEAHKRVITSPLFEGRVERANLRLNKLIDALTHHAWQNCYELCWQEFEDMHELFHTCDQPFHYITERCTTVLNQLKKFWQDHGNGPIVTLDAGPNIHLLYRQQDVALKTEFESHYLKGLANVF